MYWVTSYENEFLYNGTKHVRTHGPVTVENFYNKFKKRPTEPTLTDYGKSLEINSYLHKLNSYKHIEPNNIIFRNKNLSRDLKVEAKRLDESNHVEDLESHRSNKFETMSPFKPTKKRLPPRNISNI